MAKMEHLSTVEKYILGFLRGSLRMSTSEVKAAFRDLLHKLKQHENNPLETRAFSYLDIVSWLESKISGIPVQEVIRNKFIQGYRQGRVKDQGHT